MPSSHALLQAALVLVLGLDSSSGGPEMGSPKVMSPERALRFALDKFHGGEAAEAESILRRVNAQAPTFSGAFFSLGVVLHNTGRMGEAIPLYDEALRLDPGANRLNLGFALRQQGRYDESMAQYKATLTGDPTSLRALNGVGLAHHYMAHYEAAVEWYDHVIARDPSFAEGFYNRGVSQAHSGRVPEALDSYYAALDLQPHYPEARLNLAGLYHRRQQTEEAITHYEAAVLQLEADQASGKGGAHAFDLQIMALQNIGVAHQMNRRGAAAMASFQQALGKLESPEYMATQQAAVAKGSGKPKAIRARRDLPNKFRRSHIDLQAHIMRTRRAVCDWTAFDENLRSLVRRIDGDQLGRGYPSALAPFDLFLIDVPQAWQLKVAQRFTEKYAAARYAEHGGAAWRAAEQAKLGERARLRPRGLRAGFISYDFKDHPTAHMIEGLFVHHDAARTSGDQSVAGTADMAQGRVADRFSVYNYGKKDRSVFRERIERESKGHFVGLATLSNRAAARRIYDDRPHIMVDLQGHTLGGRAEILALRPAAVQAVFLIYPGTLGAHWIDYQIADRFVVPPDTPEASHYSERLVLLRDTYQVNFYPPFDVPQRIRAPPLPSGGPEAVPAMSHKTREEWEDERAAHGLPRKGFIFCNFNKSDKLDPITWDVWMGILRRVPSSVLWLLEGGRGREVLPNLDREAAARGVDPARLIFAPRIPKRAYLERHRFVNLVLDSFTYGAHSTATDALRGGALVVTTPGSNWPSRVASSLLHNVGLPWLVTHGKAEFENVAVRLATNPRLLAAARLKFVARLQQISPLKIYGPEFGLCATDLAKERKERWDMRRDTGFTAKDIPPALKKRCGYVDHIMRAPIVPEEERIATSSSAQSPEAIQQREHARDQALRTLALFDTRRFTKNFWRALRMMWEVHASGKKPMHLVQ